MAKAGDSYSVILSETHLGWGTHRFTYTRERIPRETYIKIPRCYAESFHLYNSNYTNGSDFFGENIFNCVSDDDQFHLILKASGCSTAGDIYAKNFHGCGNLKALTPWFDSWNAKPGDKITLTWTSPEDLIISHS